MYCCFVSNWNSFHPFCFFIILIISFNVFSFFLSFFLFLLIFKNCTFLYILYLLIIISSPQCRSQVFLTRRQYCLCIPVRSKMKVTTTTTTSATSPYMEEKTLLFFSSCSMPIRGLCRSSRHLKPISIAKNVHQVLKRKKIHLGGHRYR